MIENVIESLQAFLVDFKDNKLHKVNRLDELSNNELVELRKIAKQQYGNCEKLRLSLVALNKLCQYEQERRKKGDL